MKNGSADIQWGFIESVLWRTAFNFVESRLHSAKSEQAPLCARLHEISGRCLCVWVYPGTSPLRSAVYRLLMVVP